MYQLVCSLDEHDSVINEAALLILRKLANQSFEFLTLCNSAGLIDTLDKIQVTSGLNIIM